MIFIPLLQVKPPPAQWRVSGLCQTSQSLPWGFSSSANLRSPMPGFEPGRGGMIRLRRPLLIPPLPGPVPPSILHSPTEELLLSAFLPSSRIPLCTYLASASGQGSNCSVDIAQAFLPAPLTPWVAQMCCMAGLKRTGLGCLIF